MDVSAGVDRGVVRGTCHNEIVAEQVLDNHLGFWFGTV